jgi:hypothetical protein
MPACERTLRSDQPGLPASGNVLGNVDRQLTRAIKSLSEHDPEFWTFRVGTPRDDAHGYYQYPAMMVPQMQRELLRIVLREQPGIRRLLDPFVGSGTVVSEAMYAGLDALGQDVNPLAILVCKAKSGPFDPERLRERTEKVVQAAREDASDESEGDFPNLRKWFRPGAIVELSRIRRAIRREPELWIRQFLWVAVAETVRQTSNSRTSTYKLHVRPADEIERLPSSLATFARALERNLERYVTFGSTLGESGRLDRGRYRGIVNIALRDSRLPIAEQYDLMVTSPPYGDNASTVPYGQSSYLPLQWIDLRDIADSADQDCLRSTYEIDSRSLGGKMPRGDVMTMAQELSERCPELLKVLERLRHLPRDRMARVYFFVRDLDHCVEQIVRALRPNAYLLWTIANRRIGGSPVPLDTLLSEMMTAHGVDLVTKVERRIPSKRMATRNSITATMRAEFMLVGRKRDGKGVGPSMS